MRLFWALIGFMLLAVLAVVSLGFAYMEAVNDNMPRAIFYGAGAVAWSFLASRVIR